MSRGHVGHVSSRETTFRDSGRECRTEDGSTPLFLTGLSREFMEIGSSIIPHPSRWHQDAPRDPETTRRNSDGIA